MELEFFDEEKHAYFLERFRKFAREPSKEEKEFYEPLLNELVEKISEVLDVSTDFKLYFAATDESKLNEDASINRFVHGFSFPERMEGVKTDFIMLRAVRDREHWKKCLINMLGHEMAHQEYYRKTDKLPNTVFENILSEGYAMVRAEKVSRELGIDWKPHYRSEEEIRVEAETVIELLDDELNHEPEGLFNRGKEPCPDAEGYIIAYQVVKDLLEKEVELEEIPISLEELRGEVEDSVQGVLK